MSKLYEAISRLDEMESRGEAGQGVPELFRQKLRPQPEGSLVRLLILFGVLTLLGVAAIGITAWWQDWFDMGGVTANRPALLPASVPEPQKPVSSPVGNPKITGTTSTVNMAFATTPTGPGGDFKAHKELRIVPPRQQMGQATLSHASFRNRVKGDIASYPFSPTPGSRKITIGKLILADSQATVTEPQPLSLPERPDSSVAEAIISGTAQLRLWLQQAEQRRRNGDWEGAVVLFANVWKKSKNPAVANNLAASLIQLDRLSEAEKIITMALSQAPEDQDLQQNLRLVQRLAKQ